MPIIILKNLIIVIELNMIKHLKKRWSTYCHLLCLKFYVWINITKEEIKIKLKKKKISYLTSVFTGFLKSFYFIFSLSFKFKQSNNEKKNE